MVEEEKKNEEHNFAQWKKKIRMKPNDKQSPTTDHQ